MHIFFDALTHWSIFKLSLLFFAKHISKILLVKELLVIRITTMQRMQDSFMGTRPAPSIVKRARYERTRSCRYNTHSSHNDRQPDIFGKRNMTFILIDLT